MNSATFPASFTPGDALYPGGDIHRERPDGRDRLGDVLRAETPREHHGHRENRVPDAAAEAPVGSGSGAALFSRNERVGEERVESSGLGLGEADILGLDDVRPDEADAERLAKAVGVDGVAVELHRVDSRLSQLGSPGFHNLARRDENRPRRTEGHPPPVPRPSRMRCSAATRGIRR